MFYAAEITVPITFTVEVMQKDLMLDKCEQALLERGKAIFRRDYGNILGADFREMVIDNIRGKSVDHLSKEEQKAYTRMELAGRFR